MYLIFTSRYNFSSAILPFFLLFAHFAFTIGRKCKAHRQSQKQAYELGWEEEGSDWDRREWGKSYGKGKGKGKGKEKGKGRNNRKMGQDQSHEMVDESTPPRALESRDLEGVAKYIREGKAKKILVLVSESRKSQPSKFPPLQISN